MDADDRPQERLTSGEPPWGGWETEYRPDLIPALDPDEFREAVLSCIPRERPKDYPDYWAAPLVEGFRQGLADKARMDHLKWTPVYQRFIALFGMLERGDLGEGWPSQEQLLGGGMDVPIHPALLHTAALLPLSPQGEFDPKEFVQAAIRTAKTMKLPLLLTS